MFPQRSNLTIGQSVVAIGLVLLMQWDERVVPICFLYPLHPIAGISKYLFAGDFYVFGGFGIVGEDIFRVSRSSRITRV